MFFMLTSRIVLHDLNLEKLKELGAEVIDIEGIMVFVRFVLSEEFTINYLYHRNPDDTYLLERIKPYQITIGEYETEDETVSNIISDIDQLQNARNSNKFNTFVDTFKMLIKAKRDFDDLFLYYNVNGSDMQYIYDNVNLLSQSIYRTKEHSQRIYHKTDPQSLKD